MQHPPKLSREIAACLDSCTPKRLTRLGINALWQGGADIANAVAIPIVASAVNIIDAAQFIPISDADKLIVETRKSSHVLFAINKNSPDYLGNWFSETDLRQTEILSDRLGRHAATRAIHDALKEVTEFFELQADKMELEVNECWRFSNTRSWVCVVLL